MKRFFALALLLLMNTGALFAECCTPDINCCFNWGIGAECLYWKPAVDDTYFAIASSPDTPLFPQGRRIHNDFSYKTGFRVFAANGDTGLQVRYTRLRAIEHKTIQSTNFFATVGNPLFFSAFNNVLGSGFSSEDLLYQSLEGNFQIQLGGCSFDCDPFVGIQVAYIRLREHVNYVNDTADFTGTVKRKVRSWAVGPQFGIDFYYPLVCFPGLCSDRRVIAFTLLASGGILVSDTKSKYFDQIFKTGLTFPAIDVHDRFTWRVIPMWNARLGLNYTAQFLCGGIAFEIGYEFINYLRALTRTAFADNVDASFTVTKHYNFSAHGLYGSCLLCF